MKWFNLLTAASEASEAIAERGEIPARPATWLEALKLMGTGWGSIFIVITVIILVTVILNRTCREKK